jgi:nucleoside-diphosphate-sugar epimerase
MAILVTGCCGYIGSRLVPRLQHQGFVVIGADRRQPVNSGLDTFIQGDLLTPEVLERGLEGVDCVVHLAAAKGDWGISDSEYHRDNVEATARLISAGRARGIQDWVFFSSVASIGPSTARVDEQADLAPANAYGLSKYEAENLFQQFSSEEPRARVLIIRPSAVYGPENYPSTNFYRLIDAIYKNRFIMIGKGESIKTASYIDNVIEATLFLMNRMVPGVQKYIYVDEPAMSTAELVGHVYRLLNKKQPKWHLPLSLAKPIASIFDVMALLTGIDLPITSARVKKFCTSTYYDAGAIRRLGFTQPVSNEEALLRTVDWHLAQCAQKREPEPYKVRKLKGRDRKLYRAGSAFGYDRGRGTL